MLFLGDQVYADETTEEMQEFIEARRDIDEPPGKELKDYEEYAHLYRARVERPAEPLAALDLPSSMIFDDHDVRDDWNTSYAWKQEIEQTVVVARAGSWPGWRRTGSTSTSATSRPRSARDDEIWQRVAGHQARRRARPDRACSTTSPSGSTSSPRPTGGATPATSAATGSSSSTRGRPGCSSRTARDLLDDDEMAWLDEQMRGDVDHLFIGTSLPFLLPPGPALPRGVERGGRQRRLGQAGRRRWARSSARPSTSSTGRAFQEGFQTVAADGVEVADGKRGKAPATVTFLSGDVHHSYVSRGAARRTGPAAAGSSRPCARRSATRCRARCASPPRCSAYAVAGPVGQASSRAPPRCPTRRSLEEPAGPWFDNSIAILEDRDDGLDVRWQTGTVVDGDHLHPRLDTVADISSSPADQRGSRGQPVRFGEGQQQVLDDLHQRRVDPVLPAGDVVRGLPEAHRLHERLDQVRGLRPEEVRAEDQPGVAGRRAAWRSSVVSSIAQP